MHALPPAASPLVLSIDFPWLPPIRFGVKPYLELCRSVDQALAELEAREREEQARALAAADHDTEPGSEGGSESV